MAAVRLDSRICPPPIGFQQFSSPPEDNLLNWLVVGFSLLSALATELMKKLNDGRRRSLQNPLIIYYIMLHYGNMKGYLRTCENRVGKFLGGDIEYINGPAASQDGWAF
jgi:hypothetical protein